MFVLGISTAVPRGAAATAGTGAGRGGGLFGGEGGVVLWCPAQPRRGPFLSGAAPILAAVPFIAV